MTILRFLAAQPYGVSATAATLAVIAPDGDCANAISELRRALGDDGITPRLIVGNTGSGYTLDAEVVEAERAASEHSQQPSESGSPSGFVDELRRRGVVETAVAYVVLGWLLLQISDVAFDQLSLPAWVGTFTAYLVVVGFPIALVFAWFLDLTLKGRRISLRLDRRHASQPLGMSTVAISGALVLAGVGVFVFDRTVGLPGRADSDAAVASIPAPLVDPNSIAVLPFFNINGSDEGAIFANGLTEDIINRLARVPGLLVSSRGDAYSLPPNARSDDVRARLRVAFYIEGSVRVADDMLRVVVQLINSETGFHLVSRSFDRARADFFALQDEVTEVAVANLRVALPEETRIAFSPTTGEDADLDAYLLYRRGMDQLYRPQTPETIETALDAFDRSLAIDADYAAAYAGTCMAYVAYYLVTRDAAHIGEAESSCGAALALNANLDIVHNALGELYYRTGEYELASRSFETALAINAKAVDSLIGLGNVHLSRQELEAAESFYSRAIGLQPGNWEAYNAFGGFLYLTGRYGEAVTQYREVITLDADNTTGWTNLASSLLLSGRFDDAAAALQRTIEIEPSAVAYTNLGLLRYYSGDYDSAIESLRMATAMTPSDFLVWSNLGDALSFAAESAQAAAAFAHAEELAEAQLEINDRDPQTLANLAWIKAMLGTLDEADTLIGSAREIAAEDPYVHYIEALILVKRGDHENALERLSAAVELGYPRTLIRAEPHLQPIRSAQAFTELTAARDR